MKKISLKKSLLMLLALFMLGACSTAGNNNANDAEGPETTLPDGTPDGEDTTPEAEKSPEAEAFEDLFGNLPDEDLEGEAVGNLMDYEFDTDGVTLALSYTRATNDLQANDKVEFTLFEDSIRSDGNNGYKAAYYYEKGMQGEVYVYVWLKEDNTVVISYTSEFVKVDSTTDKMCDWWYEDEE